MELIKSVVKMFKIFVSPIKSLIKKERNLKEECIYQLTKFVYPMD